MSASNPIRIRPGLLSVTFRPLSVERIVSLAGRAGLTAIEWGGDVHVPPGNASAARAARRLTADAGLVVSAYGSYYRAGGDAAGGGFQAVLESAVELGAPTIRVWAGALGSDRANAADRQRIADDLRQACDLAGTQGKTVGLEFHPNTLTDTAASTVALLNAVGRPNLRSYWQPRIGDSVDVGLQDLSELRPYLGDLHVFHWQAEPQVQLPLADGRDRWAVYLAAAAADGVSRFASLEFVRGADEEQFLADAAVLLDLVRGVGES